MQVAEEADGAAVGRDAHQHVRGGRLGDALGRDLVAALVERLEILAVDQHVLGVLAAEHRVGLRAGRHQDGPRRQHQLARWRAGIAVGFRQ